MNYLPHFETYLNSLDQTNIELLFFALFNHRNELMESKNSMALLKVLLESEQTHSSLIETLLFGSSRLQESIDNVQRLLDIVSSHINLDK